MNPKKLNNKLSVAILVDSSIIPNWLFKTINRINDSQYASVKLMIEKDSAYKESKSFNKLGYNLYQKLESILFKFQPNALEEKRIEDLNDKINSIKVKVDVSNTLEKISESDIKKISSLNVDIIINLGFNQLSGKIFSVPKYGIWELDFTDPSKYRGKLKGFWELMNNEGELGSTLSILNEDRDKNKILFTSFSLTDDNSVNRGLSDNIWKSSAFITRKLKELYTLGEGDFNARLEKFNSFPRFYSDKYYETPGNIKALYLISRHLIKFILDIKIKPIFKFEQWVLFYLFKEDESLATSFYNYKKILPPKDRFWADPQIIFNNDKYFIFVEEYIYKKNKAHLSVFELTKDGEITKPVIILDKPYHLSFPYMFEFENNYYMVPETSPNKTIDLYKCTNFPYQWDFVQTLMEGVAAVDTVIQHHDGKWWMFTNIMEVEGSNLLDELFLFSSDSIFSKTWNPHPLNPIVSDVKSARGAGQIFPYKGNLFRPAQNCANTYGYGMTINKIIKWNEDEYEEEIVNSINPDWEKSIIATHTLTFAGGLSMVDARAWRRK